METMHGFSSRSFLQPLALSLLAALALGGLAAPLAGAAPAADTIVVGLQAEPTALDAAQITDFNSSRAAMGLYDGLVHFKDGSTELEPWLAERWTISPDGLVYTFQLRRGVKFHDGTALNAAAVVYSVLRQIDKNHPAYTTGTFAYADFTFGKVKKVEALGTYTVRFTLRERYSPFLANLAIHAASIISPAAVRKSGKNFAKNPVGTGPYRFVSWRSGVEVVLERNPSYWSKARIPQVRRVIYRPVVEDQTRLAQLESGELDFIVNIPPDDLPRLRQDARFRVQDQAGMHIWYLVLNNQTKPFNDRRVRQAVNYAVNRKTIVEGILKSTGVLAENYIPPVLWSYNKNVRGYPYDPAKAKTLLLEAGYPNGLTVDFWVPQSGSGMQQPTTMAQAIQADLARVGIKANIQTLEWGTYLEKVFVAEPKKVPPLHEMSWIGDNGDPDNFLYVLLSGLQWPPKGFNESFYKNPEVDRLLVAAQRTTSLQRRTELYMKAQELIMRDAPWVPIDHETQIVVMKRNISNFIIHPTGVFRFETVRFAR